jgi:hypothetical protein
MQSVPFPATYCGGVRERFSPAAHRGTAYRVVGGLGKAATHRELPSGANQTWRSTPAPRLRCVVRQVSASPVAASCGGLTTAFRGGLHDALVQGECVPYTVVATQPACHDAQSAEVDEGTRRTYIAGCSCLTHTSAANQTRDV